jgi:hypothetical protein
MGLLLWWKPFHAPDVATLTQLISAGKVKPVIDRRYPMSQVVDALRYVDEGRASGKVIITFQATRGTSERAHPGLREGGPHHEATTDSR